MFADFTRSGWQSDNLTDDLEAARADQRRRRSCTFLTSTPDSAVRSRRTSCGSSLAYRYEAVDQTVVDSYYDKNPSPYLYEADLTRPGRDNGKIPNQSVRMTWQIILEGQAAGLVHEPEQVPLALQHHRQPHAGRDVAAEHAVRSGDDVEVDAHANEPAAPRSGRRAGTHAVPGALSAERHRRSEQIHRPGVRSAAAQDLFDHRPGERQGVQRVRERLQRSWR